jgi:NH3-dependent NAD+ synthetase
MNTLQLGNIKARLRMMYLYNLASIHRGCVLDTDNRTEHELGFWTIHGDVGDLNCGLIHLWKTEVYELAKYLLTGYEILATRTKEIDLAISALKESIALTPTDGNGVMSGGDCVQFGLDNYNQVDDVLKTMYFNNIEDETEKANEYIRLIDSYNEQGVDKVMVRHQNSAFKRLPQPIYPNKEELGL